MYRREFYLTILTAGFSMAQLWAFMVVLTTVRVSGPALLALGLILAGAMFAVLASWHHVFRQSRNQTTELMDLSPEEISEYTG